MTDRNTWFRRSHNPSGVNGGDPTWTPSFDEPVYPTSEVRIIGEVAVRLGAPPPIVQRALRDQTYDLNDPHGRISMRDQAAFARVLRGYVPAQDLAVQSGMQLHPASFGVAGYALLTCRHLSDAFDLMNGSIARLLNLKFKPHINLVGGKAYVVLGDTFRFSTDDRVFFVRLELAKLTAFLNGLLGSRAGGSPIDLDLSSEADGNPPCAALWGLARMTRRAHLVFDAELLRGPLPLHDSETHTKCLSLCDAELDGSDCSDATSVVRRYLERDVTASLTEVAAHLHMSPRSLRRHLAACGISFRQLLAEARSDLALKCLSDPRMKTDAIAEQLGYSDAANFRHAFKRWTGKPPSALRRRPNGETIQTWDHQSGQC